MYSSYLGGNHQDFGLGIAIDGSDDACDQVYVLDHLSRNLRRISDPCGEEPAGSSTPPARPWCTPPTWAEATGAGITVDTVGDSYVTGLASSIDFPVTAGAFQTKAGNKDAGNAFVTKFNPTGTALVYSTYLGGSGNGANPDSGNSIAVESSGDAYACGQTFRPTFR